jgi:hypothetical protein
MNVPDVNPYEAPRVVESDPPSASRRMDELLKAFKGRYAQLYMDMFMAAEMSIVSGMVAWTISKNPLYSGVAVAVPSLFIGYEALKDFIEKTKTFPREMARLRSAAGEDWLREQSPVSGVSGSIARDQ